MVTPGILIGGASLLHHGWITQLHRIEEYATPPGALIECQPHWRLLARPWPYMSALERMSSHKGGRLISSPEAALADAILHKSGSAPSWCPDPDDIDPDILDGNHLPGLLQALYNLGAQDDLIQGVERVYGAVLSNSGTAPIYLR